MNSHSAFSIHSAIPERYISELNVALAAAFRAGEIAAEGYEHTHTIDTKDFGDLVSQTDVDCDAAIQAEIRKAYPDSVFVTEEITPEVTRGSDTFWIADPLDASSSYLYRTGRDVPSVMIAHFVTGAPVLSVVHFPLTSETFYAVKGYGAYKDITRLTCPTYDFDGSWIEMNHYADSRLESATFRTLRDKLRLPGGPALLTNSPPHSGMAVRIAEGRKRLAAVVHDNGAHKVKQAVWDVIPPALILEEAGGVIMTLSGRTYDPFNPEPFLMASSMQIAQAILGRID